MLRKYVSRLAVMVAVACLAACSVFGTPPADTFNKKWAEAQQTDTAVLANALTLAQHGAITPDQLRKVEQQTDNAKAGLDLARELRKENSAAADDRLSQIIVLLNSLQTALESSDPNSSLASALK